MTPPSARTKMVPVFLWGSLAMRLMTTAILARAVLARLGLISSSHPGLRSSSITASEAEYFDSVDSAVLHLGEVWNPRPPRTEQDVGGVKLYRLVSVRERRAKARRRTDQWKIAWSTSFRKAAASVEKNLQGRVLQALIELADHPLEPRGDTVKALDGEFKGMWRYRIGDYRLIYQPDVAAHVLMLIDLQPRADAYSQN